MGTAALRSGLHVAWSGGSTSPHLATKLKMFMVQPNVHASPKHPSGWEKFPGRVTDTWHTLLSGRIFRIQIPAAEREHISDRKVLNAASHYVHFKDVIIGFREPRAGVKLSGEELA